MGTTGTTCARHPDTPTRLACSRCDTPICPRCSVDAVVGQHCPSCARQQRPTVRRGRPQQYAKAAGLGLAAAAAAAVVLPAVMGLRFLAWIATGFIGFGIATAVLRGAGNNRADPFRSLAVGLSLAAVLGASLIASGSILPRGHALGIVFYLAAAYGAYTRFDR